MINCVARQRGGVDILRVARAETPLSRLGLIFEFYLFNADLHDVGIQLLQQPLNAAMFTRVSVFASASGLFLSSPAG